jgi:hypothetical protein
MYNLRMAETGLRERGKARRRAAITRAGMWFTGVGIAAL